MKTIAAALLLTVFIPGVILAQTQAKYGNDFLSIGAGARALGMGGAQTAITEDVTSAYWNVAGLASLEQPQIIYMHAERFGGVVGYDYGAAAMPLQNDKGVVGISFFRQGVDNIANTLNAWDNERGQNGGPRADPEAYITRFSAADLGIYLSYANSYNDQLSYGANVKLINQRLGPFANAWGYSLDVAARYRTVIADLGISIQDVTTMRKMWSVNEGEFEGFQDTFQDSIPTGENEYVLPSVRLGAGRVFAFTDFTVAAALDLNLLFENRRAYYLNIGAMSIEPHLGSEVTYKDRVSFRAGLTDFITDPVSGFNVSPTLGLGLRVKQFYLDYAFASFAGSASTLGYTHRISLRFDVGKK